MRRDHLSECRDLFRRSLFIVGEFGGNDYAAALGAFLPLQKVHTFVPHIVDSIGKGIEVRVTDMPPAFVPQFSFPHVHYSQSSFRPPAGVCALVQKLIAEGAVELVVPGVLPIGCFPNPDVPDHLPQAAGDVRHS